MTSSSSLDPVVTWIIGLTTTGRIGYVPLVQDLPSEEACVAWLDERKTYTRADVSFIKKTRCPDDGRCWHDCEVACWRVGNAAPLSGVYPNDEWPTQDEESAVSSAFEEFDSESTLVDSIEQIGADLGADVGESIREAANQVADAIDHATLVRALLASNDPAHARTARQLAVAKMNDAVAYAALLTTTYRALMAESEKTRSTTRWGVRRRGDATPIRIGFTSEDDARGYAWDTVIGDDQSEDDFEFYEYTPGTTRL